MTFLFHLHSIQKLSYIPVGLGKNEFSKDWLRDNTGENIAHKNSFYGEYTFYYWFWKNRLSKILENDSVWIGFCQKRRFWLKNKALKSGLILSKEDFLQDVPNQWEGYNAIICDVKTTGVLPCK